MAPHPYTLSCPMITSTVHLDRCAGGVDIASLYIAPVQESTAAASNLTLSSLSKFLHACTSSAQRDKVRASSVSLTVP